MYIHVCRFHFEKGIYNYGSREATLTAQYERPSKDQITFNTCHCVFDIFFIAATSVFFHTYAHSNTTPFSKSAYFTQRYIKVLCTLMPGDYDSFAMAI